MVSPTQAIGFEAETRVAKYLQTQGLTILERNFQARVGEIDIIAKDREHIVFIEVRSRKSSQNRFGTALESISYRKQQRLIRAAECFLMKYGLMEKHPCRFDVISVNNQKNRLRWIKNAFDVI